MDSYLSCDIAVKLGGAELLEIEKVKECLSQLSESEAKSLLLIIYGRLDIEINGTGGDEAFKETVEDTYDMFNKVP